jgi:protein-tyrosine-phosphatase
MTELFDQTFDYVVTVCDQVREQCPVFPGTPELIHRSIEDPSRVVGSEAAQMQAFEQVARQLTTRIQHLLTRATRARRGA